MDEQQREKLLRTQRSMMQLSAMVNALNHALQEHQDGPIAIQDSALQRQLLRGIPHLLVVVSGLYEMHTGGLPHLTQGVQENEPERQP